MATFALPLRYVPLPRDAPSIRVPRHLSVSESTYTALLDVRIPLTIAAVYALTVHFLNHCNTGSPYRIARTRGFRWFVVLHNIFLAVYSAWTFVGMVHGVHATLDRSSFGSAVGSLCKIRRETRVEWLLMGNGTAAIDEQGVIVTAGDVAREGLWEEALAWYGWWFYLSKFYEVVDTAVIILKGRKSSLLQTYHHAGAMVCMWAGIRYVLSFLFFRRVSAFSLEMRANKIKLHGTPDLDLLHVQFANPLVDVLLLHALGAAGQSAEGAEAELDEPANHAVCGGREFGSQLPLR